MSERAVIVLSSIVGAAVGGVAGFLLLTERGRSVRLELEPRVEEFARELAALQRTTTRAAAAAQDGWRALHQATAGQPWSSQQEPASPQGAF